MLEVRRWDSVRRRCRARSLAVLSLSVGSVGVGVVRAVVVMAEGGRADWGVLVLLLRFFIFLGVLGVVGGSGLDRGKRTLRTYHKRFQLRLGHLRR